jgi:hypothetical protein
VLPTYHRVLSLISEMQSCASRGGQRGGGLLRHLDIAAIKLVQKEAGGGCCVVYSYYILYYNLY